MWATMRPDSRTPAVSGVRRKAPSGIPARWRTRPRRTIITSLRGLPSLGLLYRLSTERARTSTNQAPIVFQDLKRLAERAPDLNIFGQSLIAREPGEWRITDAGRALLLAVERPPATASEELTLDELIEHLPASEFPPPPPPPPRRLEDHKRRRGIRRWIAQTRR